MSRILITCIHYPIASGRYIQRALKRLGHDVKTFGRSTGNEIWGMTVDQKYKWVPSLDLINNPDRYINWIADLWIHADSSYVPTATTGYKPLVLWGVDNHVRDYAGFNYDQMFLAHSWGARMNEPNAHWLPAGYDPEMHTDLHIERDIDVAMIGWPAPDRVEIVQKMTEAGLRVAAQTGLLFDEYNQLYNRAKVALCKSIAGDVPQRVFENMAQGCCVLADYQPDLIRSGFKPYKDFWLFNGADDAVMSAKWLVESDEWQRIAVCGQAKVQPHTWDNRAAQLLRTMEMSQ